MPSDPHSLFVLSGVSRRALLAGAVGLCLPGRGSAAPASQERQEPERQFPRLNRPRFFVAEPRSEEEGNACRRLLDASGVKAYCESLLREARVAQVVQSADEADYLLAPVLSGQEAVFRERHCAQEEITVTGPDGKKDRKWVERYLHDDEAMEIETTLTCRFSAAGRDTMATPLFMTHGGFRRTWHGNREHGRRVGEARVGEDAVVIGGLLKAELREHLGSLRGHSAEGALMQAIYDLCAVQGAVVERDPKAQRVTVSLGRRDGVFSREEGERGSVLELYARTGKERDYVYHDPDTGHLYIVDPATTAPDSFFAINAEVDGKPLRLGGEASRRLVALGVRVGGWGEALEVAADRCLVALRGQGNWGRTRAERHLLAGLPEDRIPMVARLRTIRRYLKKL